MAVLFETTKINDVELKNRIIMSVMHTGFSKDGYVTDRDIEFMRERAKGGAAVVSGNVAVSPYAALNGMLRLYDDSFKEGYKKLVDTVHNYNCKFMTQLFHCGRNNTEAVLGMKPIAPSAVPSPIYRTEPTPMDEALLKSTKEEFAFAALRCKECGVDIIEVNATAGYLLSEFLSPLTNLREDEYGGSEENRFRYPIEVLEAIREAVGKDQVVTMRISGSQMLEGGYDIFVMERFCKAVCEKGLVDAISVTGGWHEAPVPQISYHVPKGGFAFLANAIKRVVDVPVIACNRINDGKSANDIIEKGIADYVGVGRGILADPYLPEKIKNNRPFNSCQGCNKCIEQVLKGKEICCAFNPEAGRENTVAANKGKGEGRKLLVAGAGPAGLSAAKMAADMGFSVTVCTDEENIGGLAVIAAKPHRKEDILLYVDNKKAELDERGVKVLLSTPVSEELVEAEKPDFVIIANGSEPVKPAVKGIDAENVHQAIDVLKYSAEELNKILKGSIVVVGGGSVGIETADYLARRAVYGDETLESVKNYVAKGMPAVLSPVDVTVIEMAKSAGKDFGGIKWLVMKDVKEAGVKVTTNTKLVEVKDNSVVVEKEDGSSVEMKADTVILALGARGRENPVEDYLNSKNIPFAVIGDAKKAGSIINAHNDAFEAVFGMCID